MSKEDFYITLIKFIRDKNASGEDVGYKDAWKHIETTHPNIGEDAFMRTFFNNLVVPLADFGLGNPNHIKNNTPHVLTLDAYFHYLEHQELTEARQSSRRAHWTAIFAILMSIGVGGWQIFNSATVVLDKNQFDQLVKSSEHSAKPLMLNR